MRILMLVPHAGVGGPMPRILELLVNGLRGLGCEVSTAGWGRHSDDEGLGSKLIGRSRDVVRIRGIASTLRPDCVVVQTSHDWPSLARDIPLAAALRQTTPALVLQMHGTLADRLVSPGSAALKRATALLLRLVDGVLLLSSEERRALDAFRPTGRYEVVDNPFDEAPAGAAAKVRKLRPDEEASLLFAGRLLREKGVGEAVEAVALLNGRRPARLLVAGSGPAEGELSAAVSERGLVGKVELAGHLSAGALQRAYRDADVFVFPTYHPEGFPTVIAEAMSAGLPIVTTKTRGSADHLESGVNALFVPPHDPDALAAALEGLLADHELRARMARANRAAVKRFAPDRVAKEYLAALSRIVG
jgi:glycosyltransferase involved in cell wall biosynthesis